MTLRPGRPFSTMIALVMFCSAAVALASAQQRGKQTTPAASKPATGTKAVELKTACAFFLGKGTKSDRSFCEVINAATADESMSMTIPAHTGPSTFFFDLHPRFEVTEPDNTPGKAFQRHTAAVAVVGPTGDVIDRRVVVGEYRSTMDLFDRIGLEKPGQFRVVSPGIPTPMKVEIPASVSTVGVVGLRLEITNRFITQGFTQAGLPIALISSWRVEYTPK